MAPNHSPLMNSRRSGRASAVREVVAWAMDPPAGRRSTLSSEILAAGESGRADCQSRKRGYARELLISRRAVVAPASLPASDEHNRAKIASHVRTAAWRHG